MIPYRSEESCWAPGRWVVGLEPLMVISTPPGMVVGVVVVA